MTMKSKSDTDDDDGDKECEDSPVRSSWGALVFFVAAQTLVFLLAFIAWYMIWMTPRPFLTTVSLGLCDFPDLAAVYAAIAFDVAVIVVVFVVDLTLFNVRDDPPPPSKRRSGAAPTQNIPAFYQYVYITRGPCKPCRNVLPYISIVLLLLSLMSFIEIAVVRVTERVVAHYVVAGFTTVVTYICEVLLYLRRVQEDHGLIETSVHFGKRDLVTSDGRVHASVLLRPYLLLYNVAFLVVQLALILAFSIGLMVDPRLEMTHAWAGLELAMYFGFAALFSMRIHDLKQTYRKTVPTNHHVKTAGKKARRRTARRRRDHQRSDSDSGSASASDNDDDDDVERPPAARAAANAQAIEKALGGGGFQKGPGAPSGRSTRAGYSSLTFVHHGTRASLVHPDSTALFPTAPDKSPFLRAARSTFAGGSTVV